jgi:two-component system phosphate regulon sensor histidine kinase PhoR
MSIPVFALVTGLASITALALTRISTLAKEKRILAYDREERRGALARTSKLLIDKNMELFDQNLRQQREIESRQDFINIVSHQLRTPATEVKWGLEALSGEMKRQRRRGRELEYFEKLEHSAERMVQLIDSLVRLMTIDEQFRRKVATPYEPDPVVRRVAQELGKRFADRHINLTLILEGSGEIETMDSDSLELVVENLIENAYEYTLPGGSVTVTTGHTHEGGFMCTVADTGIGIPEERRASVFVKFQRSENASHLNTSGMGLGLYLVKNIIERHDGTVSFESAVGKGTTFTITLPEART